MSNRQALWNEILQYWVKISKMSKLALARWFSWWECRPIRQKVAGLITGQGEQGRQPIDVSHIDVFLFLPLKSVNVSLGED